jgi:hypothetical protein
MITLHAIFSALGRPPVPLEEPAWAEALANPSERQAAAGYWHAIVDELHARGTIEPVHGPAVLRLVIAYLVADRASLEVLRDGMGERAWRVYLEAAQLAAAIESDLGLLPLSRARIGRR